MGIPLIAQANRAWRQIDPKLWIRTQPPCSLAQVSAATALVAAPSPDVKDTYGLLGSPRKLNDKLRLLHIQPVPSSHGPPPDAGDLTVPTVTNRFGRRANVTNSKSPSRIS